MTTPPNTPNTPVSGETQEVWRERWLSYLAQAECLDEDAIPWLVAEFVKQNVEEVLTLKDQQRDEAVRKERERILKQINSVPRHAVTRGAHLKRNTDCVIEPVLSQEAMALYEDDLLKALTPPQSSDNKKGL